MPATRLATAVTVLILAWSPMALAAGGELTILGGQASGDYGTETDNTRQSAAVRFTLGNETQLRIDFEFLRIDRALGVTQTSFGTIPTLHHQSSGMSGNPDSGQGPTGGTTGGTLPIDDPSPVTTTPEEDWATGIGDLRLSVSRLLMGGGAKLFRLDVQVGTKVPTADEQELLGTGEWDYRLGLAAQYRFWAMTGFGGLGWNVLGDPAWAELQDVADAYVGLESPPIGGKIIVSGWLEGNEEVIAGSGSRTALALSLRSTKNVRWQAQIRAGLGGSSEDLSALFGVSIGLSTPTVGSRRAG